MSLEKAVNYAINSMEMEGYKFTPQELEMWDKIKKGELPLEYVWEDAANFERLMREKHPELFADREE